MTPALSSLTTTRMVRTPPTTALTVPDAYLDFEYSRPWRKPFIELLLLLRIITSNDSGEIEHQCFCFQHTCDLSELSTVFLSVYPSGFEYKIHLDDIHFDDSGPCSGQIFVAELEEYANRVLSRVRVSVFVHSCITPLTQRSKIQDYRDRLIKDDIIHDTGPFADVNLLTCPLCRSRLRNCGECHATVVCSNNHCAGSDVVDFEYCVAHGLMVCHGCLDSKGLDPNSGFVRCPSCNSWRCSLEVGWCPGRIIHPAPGTKELAELCRTLDLDNKLIVRSHLPTPGPCRSCINSGHVDAWQACSHGRSGLCPSNAHFSKLKLDYAYCPECITELEGRRCACGAVWFCDACLVADSNSPGHPYLTSCPRCGASYCRKPNGCQYCHFCEICRRTGVCFGCQAREKGDVRGEGTSGECSQPVNAFEQCTNCRRSMCNECCSTAKDGVTQCPGCHRWMCGDCAQAFGLCYLCS